jgi:hypothetical protein
MTIHTLCTNIQEPAKWTAATVLELDLVRDIIGRSWLLYYVTVLILSVWLSQDRGKGHVE